MGKPGQRCVGDARPSESEKCLRGKEEWGIGYLKEGKKESPPGSPINGFSTRGGDLDPWQESTRLRDSRSRGSHQQKGRKEKHGSVKGAYWIRMT